MVVFLFIFIFFFFHFYCLFFFFFQAEDGIRDIGVTGVQTCALPICSALKALLVAVFGLIVALVGTDPITGINRLTFGSIDLLEGIDFLPVAIGIFGRSEERRVGKECRSRWSPYH